MNEILVVQMFKRTKHPIVTESTDRSNKGEIIVT